MKKKLDLQIGNEELALFCYKLKFLSVLSVHLSMIETITLENVNKFDGR